MIIMLWNLKLIIISAVHIHCNVITMVSNNKNNDNLIIADYYIHLQLIPYIHNRILWYVIYKNKQEV